MITRNHWKAFELCDQHSKSVRVAAEIMGIKPNGVRQLMKELRAEQPGLFPVRTERAKFHKQNMPRDGYSLYRIDDIEEDDIRQKF